MSVFKFKSLKYSISLTLNPYRLLTPSNPHIDIVHGCVKILSAVCSKPGTLSMVSTLITQKTVVSQELMQSLVERLETDDSESAGTVG